MDEPSPAGKSVAPAIAQLVAASLAGLVALPSLFGAAPSRAGPAAIGWLIGALLMVAWLLAIAPALARALAGLEAWSSPGEAGPGAGWRGAPGPPGRAGAALARWLVVAGYAFLAPAMVRAPLVAVLSPLIDPTSVEAVFGATALLLLLAALYRLHHAAGPLLQDAARQALDALLPTVEATSDGGEAVAGPIEPTTSGRQPTRPAPATRLATPAEPTLPDAAAATRPAAAEPTLPEPDATTRAAEPAGLETEPARTVPALRLDDRTQPAADSEVGESTVPAQDARPDLEARGDGSPGQ